VCSSGGGSPNLFESIIKNLIEDRKMLVQACVYQYDNHLLPESMHTHSPSTCVLPGHYHAKMNMYIAVCKTDAGTVQFEVIDKATMVDRERAEHGNRRVLSWRSI
jgi:hypothetical protein